MYGDDEKNEDRKKLTLPLWIRKEVTPMRKSICKEIHKIKYSENYGAV
jgi:hypothetical protein